MSLLVGRRMSAQLVTVGSGARIDEARRLLQHHHIRHLPVVDGRRLLGIVTDRDLRAAEGRGEPRVPLLVADVMTESVITVGPETTVDQVAMLMAENKIGGLPVVNADDELIGIITESDILNVLLDAMGVGTGAARLEVLLPDYPGTLAQVARVLGERGVNILSVLSAKADEGKKVLVFRIVSGDLEAVVTELAQRGVEVVSVEEGHG